MSKRDDERELLHDYELWKGREQPDAIGAFLQEREDKANTRRVTEALRVLNELLPAMRRADPEDNILATLEGVRDILEADRPFIDDSSLTEPGKRSYV